MTPYNPISYENATSLKAQTLVMMDRAIEPYANHKESVEALKIELGKAYEYVKGFSDNRTTTKQWEILVKEDGALIGKFHKRWKERSTMSNIIIAEYKKLIATAFDEIICLEANKKEPTKCKATTDLGEE